MYIYSIRGIYVYNIYYNYMLLYYIICYNIYDNVIHIINVYKLNLKSRND